MAGRPPKYREAVSVSVVMPKDMLYIIEDFAQEQGISRSEAVVLLLTSADKTMARTLQENLRLLNELLKKAKQENKRLAKELERIGKRLNPVTIYTEVETPKEIVDIVEKNKNRIQKALRGKSEFERIEVIEALVDALTNELGEQLLREGKIIRERMVQRLIRGEIGRRFLNERR